MGKPKIYTKEDCAPEDLLQYALDHIEAAELLIEKSNACFYDSAGYLAHIGIELLFKSWILHISNYFNEGHNLKKLVAQLMSLQKSFVLSSREFQTLEYLSNFEKLRYPDRRRPVEIGEEDFQQVSDIVDALWQQMPVSLIDAYEKLTPGKKGGRILLVRPEHIKRNLKLETGIDP